MSTVLALSLSILTLAVSISLYYWSYYTFDKTFEDYRIDTQTDIDNMNRGVQNEWILGASAHSIDLVEAIHGDKTAEHILEQAQKQRESSQVYREEIDGKYLLYRIEVDTENGERIYRYSVIKDIYLEHYPQILVQIIVMSLAVFAITLLLVLRITYKMTKNIRATSKSIQDMAYNDEAPNIDIDEIQDPDLRDLAQSFMYTKAELDNRRAMQQASMQYISHELKTPVMIIKTYADSAREGIYPKGDLDSSLVVIENQTDRIQKSVNDLLLVSKLKADYTNELPERICLSEVVSMLITTMQKFSQGRELLLDLDEDVYIAGFPSQIQVLIENLYINQSRYAKTFIRIQLLKDTDNKVAYLIFSNDGPAIDPELQKDLFKPFVKGENGNTGLGLAIVQRICEMHEGEIALTSEENITSFTITLPLA